MSHASQPFMPPALFAAMVIRPAITAIGLWSQAAEELLLGTALQESGLAALVQAGNGPALGPFQMEPATHDDIWLNFLVGRPALAPALDTLLVRIGNQHDAHQMVGNLYYAAAMCRLAYRRVAAKLPSSGDVADQAAYWKTYYNTAGGAGSTREYIANWRAAFPGGYVPTGV